MSAMVLLVVASLTSQSLAAQDDATAALARRATRIGVLATAIPVAAGATLAATSHDGGPLALVGFGLVLGPAFGYQEAGMGGRGWRGAGLRAGLVLGSFMGAVAVCWDCSHDQEQAAGLVFAGGMALVAASAIYDLHRLPHNIRRHDAQRRLAVAPVYVPGERRVGVQGQISF